MMCDFEHVVANSYRCKRCGDVIVTPNPSIVARCKRSPRDEPAPPSLARKAWNFAAALAAHIGDGMKKRDKAEIEALFTICKACPLFNGKTCTHKQCGCAANREQKFFNKLAWRSEHCPVGKW